MSAISVNQLTKRVRDADGWLTILDQINFTLGSGETLAVVGASGSGKSTLLGLLAGLDTPSEGSVTIAGTSLFDLDEDERATWRGENLGFVFQNFQLLPQMTALENVLLPLELAGVRDADSRARAMLERVGLGARLKHYPRTMSGGEQQRVALARAFSPGPKLLFADEPTGSLDSATGERVIDLLFEMNQDAGATLVLVTHDNALAQRCRYQLCLQGGRLNAEQSQLPSDDGSARDAISATL